MTHSVYHDKKITQSYTVLSYDCDRQQNIKISSLQKLFQDAADQHCINFGCDYNTLRNKYGVCFVLVKLSINIFHPVKLNEQIELTTWHKGEKGVQYFRDFVIKDKKGTVLAEAGSSWVVIDPETHKMKRPSEANLPIEACLTDNVDTSRLDKMHLPELEPVGEMKVRYTQIDPNGHLTNWVYGDIVTDFLPDMKGMRVAEADISFIAEAYENETLKIFRGQKDEIFYFRGEHPRGKCFEARVRLVKNI